MSYRLVDGEYALDGGGNPIPIEYYEDLLQKVLLALKAKRGKFYPNKDFGSRLNEIEKEPFEKYAESYARQALDGFDGVFVKKVIKDGNALTFQLLVNEREEEVILQIEEDI